MSSDQTSGLGRLKEWRREIVFLIGVAVSAFAVDYRAGERMDDMERDLASVHGDLASVRNDLAAVRNDLAAVRNDQVALSDRMENNFKAVNNHMENNFRAVNDRMENNFRTVSDRLDNALSSYVTRAELPEIVERKIDARIIQAGFESLFHRTPPSNQ